MQNHLVVAKRLLHVVWIGTVPDEEGDVGGVLPRRDVLERSRGEVVKDRDVMLLGGEVVEQVAANEARAAGNQ